MMLMSQSAQDTQDDVCHKVEYPTRQLRTFDCSSLVVLFRLLIWSEQRHVRKFYWLGFFSYFFW